MTRRRATLLCVLSLAALPASAQAAAGAEVCAHRAGIYAAPNGVAVGVVRRGDEVLVLRRGGSWWRVRARFGTRGWIRAQMLCPERR